MRRLVLILALTGLASPAFAQGEGDCFGDWNLGDPSQVNMATVIAKPRLNFIKSRSQDKACPSQADQCREKAFIVPGDQVVTVGQQGGLTCAAYVNPKGLVRAGWLASNGLAVSAKAAVGFEDWAGDWTGGPEQTFSLKRGPKPGSLTAKGEATFGAQDPARIKRGAVNVGEFEGVASPKGATLVVTMDDTGKNAWSPQESGDCSVRMVHLGAMILVEDNRNCGGMNVSFTGAYRKIR